MREWLLNALGGLFVAGCLIASHVMVLILARLFGWILEEEPECMHNIIIDFNSDWSYALEVISYIGITIVILSYISSITTKNWIPCMLFMAFLYALIVIANGIATYFYVVTYVNNWWYNELCTEESDVTYVYAMLIGSYVLLVIGVAGFVCCFITYHRH